MSEPIVITDSSVEQWRPVVGFEGWYEVSTFGNVKRVRAGQGVARLGMPLRPGLDSWGYPQVCLNREGKKRMCLVHHLVADAFIGPRPKRIEVNHIDGDKLNAKPENLEYVTSKENCHHAFRLGLRTPNAGPRHAHKLEPHQVLEIRSLVSGGDLTNKQIAARYGVTGALISHIAKRRIWKML
jgi:hypothetical protein